MPDLGQYAANVLGAYAVGILLLIGLTLVSVWRARKIKSQLKELEAGRRKNA